MQQQDSLEGYWKVFATSAWKSMLFWLSNTRPDGHQKLYVGILLVYVYILIILLYK